MRNETLLERLDRTPVAYACLFAYITMAFVVDPQNPTNPHYQGLIQHGSAVDLLVPIQPWRLISYAFLHGGLIHLLFNSYFLYQVGPMLEREIGSLRFSLLYLVTAVGACLSALLWNPGNLVGGSGALFGMLGCIVAMNMRRGKNLLEFLSNRGSRQILVMIAINLMIGWIIPFISNTAHIGGMISGFVLTFCFLERGRSIPDKLSRVIQAAWIALFLGITIFVLVPVARSGDFPDIYFNSRNTPRAKAFKLESEGFTAQQARRIVEHYGR